MMIGQNVQMECVKMVTYGWKMALAKVRYRNSYHNDINGLTISIQFAYLFEY